MLWFAGFSLWYSFIDILTQPAMHSYKNSYIVICASWFKYNRVVGPIIITTYCTSFGLTVVLLAIHFVYRFIAMSRPSEIRFFQWPLALIWPAIFSGVAIFWWCNVYFLLSINDTLNDYMRETIALNYQDDIEELSYIGPLYFVTGPNGEMKIVWESCIGMLNVGIISGTTLIIIITLGVKIYKKMQSVKDMVAEKTRELQRQLFYSLMVQTIVPIIFMYNPTTILFVAPVFGIELGSMANITSIGLALYPALDPLVVMFFIRDYRKYILKKVCFHKTVSPTTTAATKTDTVI
ncbi:unnamed protein product [Caenorhabditis angaria]|uniref:Serpentine receptor class r-10 n=1 Tax=Caenorhabditis angaria TaxID=860376 RepID=A0A9P1IY46_9PELO|nr:unnamed protein product [Caenorhabditis angaria]